MLLSGCTASLISNFQIYLWTMGGVSEIKIRRLDFCNVSLPVQIQKAVRSYRSLVLEPETLTPAGYAIEGEYRLRHLKIYLKAIEGASIFLHGTQKNNTQKNRSYITLYD